MPDIVAGVVTVQFEADMDRLNKARTLYEETLKSMNKNNTVSVTATLNVVPNVNPDAVMGAWKRAIKGKKYYLPVTPQIDTKNLGADIAAAMARTPSAAPKVTPTTPQAPSVAPPAASSTKPKKAPKTIAAVMAEQYQTRTKRNLIYSDPEAPFSNDIIHAEALSGTHAGNKRRTIGYKNASLLSAEDYTNEYNARAKANIRRLEGQLGVNPNLVAREEHLRSQLKTRTDNPRPSITPAQLKAEERALADERAAELARLRQNIISRSAPAYQLMTPAEQRAIASNPNLAVPWNRGISRLNTSGVAAPTSAPAYQPWTAAEQRAVANNPNLASLWNRGISQSKTSGVPLPSSPVGPVVHPNMTPSYVNSAAYNRALVSSGLASVWDPGMADIKSRGGIIPNANATKGLRERLLAGRTDGYYQFASGMTATMMTTAPIVGGVSAATKAAISFEDAFAGVKKTVEGTSEEIELIRQQLREMAAGKDAIPVSFEELSKVAENAGQLGIHTHEISSFTEVMAKLGATTNMSSDQAADSLARFANITGMSHDNFDRLGSTLVDLGNKFAGTEKEIALMSMRIAGAGKQVGMTEPQILALSTTMSSLGIRADLGGTAVSRALQEMSKAVSGGGDDLEKFASVAGISGEKFAEVFRKDAAQAFALFVSGIKKANDEGKNVFSLLDSLGLSAMRSKDVLNRTSNATKLLAEAMQVGNKAWSDNTALQDEFARRAETTASKLQVFKNRIAEASVAATEHMLPALGRAVDQLGSELPDAVGFAVRALDEMPVSVKATAGALAGLFLLAGPANAFLGIIKMLGAGLATASGMSMGAGGALALANPVALAATVATIGAAVLIGKSLVNVYGEIDAAQEAVKQSGEEAGKAIKEAISVAPRGSELEGALGRVSVKVDLAKSAEEINAAMDSISYVERSLKIGTKTDLQEVVLSSLNKAKEELKKKENLLSVDVLVKPIWASTLDSMTNWMTSSASDGLGTRLMQTGKEWGEMQSTAGDNLYWLGGHLDAVAAPLFGAQSDASRDAATEERIAKMSKAGVARAKQLEQNRIQKDFQEGFSRVIGKQAAPAGETIEQKLERLRKQKNQPQQPGNNAGTSNEPSEEQKKAVADRAEAEERKRLQRIQSAYQAYGNVLEGITGKIRAFSEETEEARVRNEMMKRTMDSVSDSYKNQAIHVAKLYDEMERMTTLRDSLRGLFDTFQNKLVGMGKLSDPQQGVISKLESALGYKAVMNSRYGQAMSASGNMLSGVDSTLDSVAQSQMNLRFDGSGKNILGVASSMVGLTGSDARATGAAAGKEWCVGFVQQVHKEATGGVLANGTLAVKELKRWADKKGISYNGKPNVGDYVTLQNVGNTKSHTAVVSSVNEDGTFQTIGGNEGGIRNNWKSKVVRGAKYKWDHPGVTFIRSGATGAVSSTVGKPSIPGMSPLVASAIQGVRPDFDGSLGFLSSAPQWMRDAWGTPVKEDDEFSEMRRLAQAQLFSRDFIRNSKKIPRSVLEPSIRALSQYSSGMDSQEMRFIGDKSVREAERAAMQDAFLSTLPGDHDASIRYDISRGLLTRGQGARRLAAAQSGRRSEGRTDIGMGWLDIGAMDSSLMAGRLAMGSGVSAMDAARAREDYRQGLIRSRKYDTAGLGQMMTQYDYRTGVSNDFELDKWRIGDSLATERSRSRRAMEQGFAFSETPESEVRAQTAALEKYQQVYDRVLEAGRTPSEAMAEARAESAKTLEFERQAGAVDKLIAAQKQLKDLRESDKSYSDTRRAEQRYGIGNIMAQVEAETKAAARRIMDDKTIDDASRQQIIDQTNLGIRRRILGGADSAHDLSVRSAEDDRRLNSLKLQLVLQGRTADSIDKQVEYARDYAQILESLGGPLRDGAAVRAGELATLRSQNRELERQSQIQREIREIGKDTADAKTMNEFERQMLRDGLGSGLRGPALRYRQEQLRIDRIEDPKLRKAEMDKLMSEMGDMIPTEQARSDRQALDASAERLASIREEMAMMTARTDAQREAIRVESELARARRDGIPISDEVAQKLREEAKQIVEYQDRIKDFTAFQNTANTLRDSIANNLKESGKDIGSALKGVLGDMGDFAQDIALKQFANWATGKIMPGSVFEDERFRVTAPNMVDPTSEFAGVFASNPTAGVVANMASQVLGFGGASGMSAQNLIIDANNVTINSSGASGLMNPTTGSPTQSQRIFGLVGSGIAAISRNGGMFG